MWNAIYVLGACILIFVPCVVSADSAGRFADKLLGAATSISLSVLNFLKGLFSINNERGNAFEQLGSSLLRWVQDRVPKVWRGMKTTPTARWPMLLLIAAVLLATLWCVLLLESRVILLGLDVVLGSAPVEQSHADGLLSTLTASEADVQQGIGQTPKHDESLSTRFYKSAVKPFVEIWEAENGFMAVALTLLQAGLGLFVLWNTGEDAFERQFLVFWRERRLVLLTFLGLDFSLAVLGAVRGWEIVELPKGGTSWLPLFAAVFAGSLALWTPWATAYIVHYVLEPICVLIALVVSAVGPFVVAFAGILVALSVTLCLALAGFAVRGTLWASKAFARRLHILLQPEFETEIFQPNTQSFDQVRGVRSVEPGQELVLRVSMLDRNYLRDTVFHWDTPDGHGRVEYSPQAPAAVYHAPESTGLKIATLTIKRRNGQVEHILDFPIAVVPNGR